MGKMKKSGLCYLSSAMPPLRAKFLSFSNVEKDVTEKRKTNIAKIIRTIMIPHLSYETASKHRFP
jgi:hypothetical protein